jgi:D-alanyl-lipoteichoic acid acyltransferase DltB (MBOAT superfamily)
MLFNSQQYIALFLPLVVGGFYLLARAPNLLRIYWLVAASLVFYGLWNPVFLWVLGGSITVNYGLARAIDATRGRPHASRWLTGLGIAGNLTLLGYFKYANFFVDNLNALTGSAIALAPIVLPLGISFFTFQKIAFLVDVRQGLARSLRFADYLLFVTFFPQLVSGPITHHAEVMPQFQAGRLGAQPWNNLAVGLTIFFIGLWKKVIIADPLGAFAGPVFHAAEQSGVDALHAWCATLAYTMQIYFDFSGYTDMAIGAARLFGITLPLNFHSPYKSLSIVDFWRRWHMTLSRFLRDYLYFPLGGNRRGPVRRYFNIAVVMLLGGLWHGAAWKFAIWGGLHGIYLGVNHAWTAATGTRAMKRGLVYRLAAWALTFVAVLHAWVFFRAESLAGAISMLQSMYGAAVPPSVLKGHIAWRGLVLASIFALLLPNTQQIMRLARPALTNVSLALPHVRLLPRRMRALATWQPNWQWAVFSVIAFFSALATLSQPTEFLYWSF